MNTENRVIFTKEMRKDYTILVPTMLPIHFRLIAEIMNRNGYHVEVLDTKGRHIVEKGLRYVHNDACYPAVLVIGQLLDALEGGKYDPDRVALMLMQTGGGCRASNYVSLLRKALQRAGHENVPVLSFNLVGIEKNPGFQLTLPLLIKMLYAVLFGDLLMTLTQRTRPYETEPGAAERLAEQWTNRLVCEMQKSRVKLPYRSVKELYRYLLKKQRDLIAAIRSNSNFTPPTDFAHTRSLVDGYMHVGAKMGEGWLLTAEMLELIDSGTKNVICTQPFGCLPNHIVGKGVMKHIRETHPDANLIAIDYDPSATAINQENRIKLMLANAARQAQEEPKRGI